MADEAGRAQGDDGEELDAEAQARRRLALAQIRQYPDPALRMRANEVEQFDDALAARRADDRADGRRARRRARRDAGRRAPAAVRLRRRARTSRACSSTPRSSSRATSVETDDEGCLSLQRVLVPVERSVRVTIEAQDLDGDDVRLELDELAARVAQHELDHLDGVLILDRTTHDARREAMATLRAQLSLA